MFSSSNCSSLLISSRRLAVAGVVHEEAKAEETLNGSIAEDGNGRDSKAFETEIAGVVVVEVEVEVVDVAIIVNLVIF